MTTFISIWLLCGIYASIGFLLAERRLPTLKLMISGVILGPLPYLALIFGFITIAVVGIDSAKATVDSIKQELQKAKAKANSKS